MEATKPCKRSWLEPTQRQWVRKRLAQRTRRAVRAMTQVISAEDISERLARCRRPQTRVLEAFFTPPAAAPTPTPVPAARIGITRIGHDRLAADAPGSEPIVEETAYALAREALAELALQPEPVEDLAQLVERRATAMLEASESFTDGELLSVTLFIGQHNEVAFRAAFDEL